MNPWLLSWVCVCVCVYECLWVGGWGVLSKMWRDCAQINSSGEVLPSTWRTFPNVLTLNVDCALNYAIWTKN